MPDFYDQLAPYYHLVYQDWSDTVDRQGERLHGLIASVAPNARRILDATAGIGTQALGLAARGLVVSASDLSAGSIARLDAEAAARSLSISTKVADLRALPTAWNDRFDVVLSCDNSIPHLTTDDAIRDAFHAMSAVLEPGGVCLISVRDYERVDRSDHIRPYGIRRSGDQRAVVFQVWEWDGAWYDCSMYFVIHEGANPPQTIVATTRYFAVSCGRLLESMSDAGFTRVVRLDDAFYQPVLIGHKP